MRKLLFLSTATVFGLSHLAGVTAEKIDFVRQVKPILEAYCVSCHNDRHAAENGELSISTKAKAFAGSEDGPIIKPGDPDKSSFYKLTLARPTSKRLMPPIDKGGPLPKEMTDIIRDWIAQGAEWPDDVALTPVRRIEFARDVQSLLQRGGPFNKVEKETLRLWVEQGARWPEGSKIAGSDAAGYSEPTLVAEIYKKIVANSKETAEAEMKQYKVDLPQEGSRFTRMHFSMLPIKGGTFTMGNYDPNAETNERPAHTVTVDPFWMQQCEVTWNEYEPYMLQEQRRASGWKTDSLADSVAYPSKPYLEMSFGMGKDGYPAISMTQHAANKYCQWLSARTGHFYRLPTEAEWEYACRAGTTTAYSFGDDPAALGNYAWFEDNAEKYQKVGKKLPNPWGLHDMHGNVAEWTLDGFAAYDKAATINPWTKATNTYPHVVRGGSWAEPDTACRSSSRRPSEPIWNGDNALPKSSWHLTHITVGFRIVRPLKVPTKEEMFAYWNSGVEVDDSRVTDRVPTK